MKKNIFSKLFLAGALTVMAGVGTSCDDFLTIIPTGSVPEESFWQDVNDLNNVRAGAYQNLTNGNITSRILYWGELRADNFVLNDIGNSDMTYVMEGTLLPSNQMYDWAKFYESINYCNLIIEKGYDMAVEAVDPSFSMQDYNLVKTEMLALRSLYYFYLVRAYRDLPYVEKALRTDADAMAFKPQAVPGVAILGKMIEDLEANINYVYKNYGNRADNKGRFCERSIHALLADLYLWRGCMLQKWAEKNNNAKNLFTPEVKYVNLTDQPVLGAAGDTVSWVRADGQAITSTYTDALARDCFEKSVEHSSYVISVVRKECDERIAKNPTAYTKDEISQRYPLIRTTLNPVQTEDNVLKDIFFNGNSDESLFEVQFDGTINSNGTFASYFTSVSNNQPSPGTLVLSTTLHAGSTTINPTVGWGKTDFRLAENYHFASTEMVKPFHKFVLSSLVIKTPEDLTEEPYSSTYRDKMNVNWPVYRLTDVMLIKAEAIARLGMMEVSGYETGSTNMKEGFFLVNEIFRRCNPALAGVNESSDAAASLRSNRLDETYGDSRSASELLSLTYRERQREFVGEGKRWFDLVRQAEASGDVATTLSSYSGLKSSLQRRLANYGLYSLYCPIVTSEMNVSGYEYGGRLRQNPVWQRFSEN